jgi:hypothetical protein
MAGILSDAGVEWVLQATRRSAVGFRHNLIYLLQLPTLKYRNRVRSIVNIQSEEHQKQRKKLSLSLSYNSISFHFV